MAGRPWPDCLPAQPEKAPLCCRPALCASCRLLFASAWASSNCQAQTRPPPSLYVSPVRGLVAIRHRRPTTIRSARRPPYQSCVAAIDSKADDRLREGAELARLRWAGLPAEHCGRGLPSSNASLEPGEVRPRASTKIGAGGREARNTRRRRAAIPRPVPAKRLAARRASPEERRNLRFSAAIKLAPRDAISSVGRPAAGPAALGKIGPNAENRYLSAALAFEQGASRTFTSLRSVGAPTAQGQHVPQVYKSRQSIPR
jgi:hypothetical protein